MKRTISTALLLAALSASPLAAAPEFQLLYPNGIPRVQISGDYRNTSYTVWRGTGPDGPFTLVTDADVLCVGSCFADDYSALPAHRYWYRFDVIDPQAGLLRFGPFQADISPDLARRLSANVSPNPGNGVTRVGLFLAGAPGSTIHTEAAVFDLQGRRLTTLHRGPLPSGPTRLTWNGRADDGRALPSGLYLLRVVTADGRHTVARVVRTR